MISWVFLVSSYWEEFWVHGQWQWPNRGVRIGEASHPGRPMETLSTPPAAPRPAPQDLDVTPIFGGISPGMNGAMRHISCNAEVGDTHDTAGGGTPTESFHFGPDVEMLGPIKRSMEVEDLFDDFMAQIDIDPGTIGPSVPSLPPPPPDPPENMPLLSCPFCVAWKTPHGPGALMRHISCNHGGTRFGDAGCAIFRGLEKGVCCQPD